MREPAPLTPTARAVILVLVLATFLAGMFGTSVSYIPEPSFRPVAFVIAVGLVAFIAAMMWRNRASASPIAEGRVAAAVKLTLAPVVFTYFFYVCFYVTVPAWVTRVVGAAESREYQVESIRRSSSRARLCPYRMTLRGVVFLLDDSFCVSEEFAREHPVGAQIRVDGERSVLGYRFDFAS